MKSWHFFCLGLGLWLGFGQLHAAPPAKGAVQSKYRSQVMAVDRTGTEETLENLQKNVHQLTILMNTFPPGPKRNELLLNRAVASNLYARKRLLEGKTLVMDSIGKQYVESAVRDIQYVLASKVSTPATLTKARMALGVSYVYQEKMDLARPIFLKILDEQPADESTGWMALVVAEDLFDAKEYARALAYYRKFEKRLPPESLEFARYKQAWCLVNLNQMDQAEATFTSLIRSPSKTGVRKDCIRDMAFLLGRAKDPARPLAAAKRLFQDPKDEITFLGYVRSGMETQGAASAHATIVARLLELETEPAKRLDLLIANFRVSRKTFASREYHSAFVKVRDFIRSVPIERKSATFTNVSGILEAEVQTLLRGFVEAFSGRIKSPEFNLQTELLPPLREQFDFFNAYFPDSAARPKVVRIWLDICMDSKDWACATQAIQAVLSDPKRLASLRPVVLLNRIFVLETVNKGKPISDELGGALKEAVQEGEQLPGWLRIAKSYGAFLMSRKTYNDAIVLFGRIYQKEKSPENLQALQWARFQSGEMDSLLKEQEPEEFSKTAPALGEIRREAALSLAIKAKAQKDLASYKRNIGLFLALQPAKEKAFIARLDYAQFLAENQLYPELAAELFSLPIELRYSKEFDPHLKVAWLWNMKRGAYGDAERLMASSPPNGAEAGSNLYLRTLAIAAGEVLPARELLLALPPVKREYILGLFALLRPEAVLAYLEPVRKGSKSKKLNGAEADLAELALRIKTGDWHVSEVKVPVPPPGALEHKIAKLLASVSQGYRMDKVTQVAAEARKLREDVAREIVGKLPEVQIRVLSSAIRLENRVAELIQKSPAPPKLSEEEIAKYREAVGKVAEEFQNQGLEYGKVIQGIQDKLNEVQQRFQARIIPKPDMGHWDWPKPYLKAPVLATVKQAVEAKRPIEAMVLLDLLRGEVWKDTDEEEYYFVRAGILLSAASNQALQIYLLDELEKRDQKEVIESWRKTAGKEGK